VSQCNSEGVAEFVRLVTELSDITEEMTSYEKEFIEDNFDRVESYGDKTVVSESQLEFARKLYRRIL
jgi:hypothetical protein